jgi:RNA 2',3'-cyclic 3'-phosphodiesterase
MVRLFVAVDLPESARGEVKALCKGLPAAHWSHAAQLHLTLRFLGDTPEESVPGLRAALAGVRAAPFSASLARVGVFPLKKRPARVLWAGVTPEEPLVTLQAAIDQRLGPDPEAVARGFSPHLTLARFREDPEPALGRYLDQHAGFAGTVFAVEAFRLYRSTLAREGPIHEVIETYPLASR